MVLSYNELVELVEAGGVENVDPAHINGASIDLTLAGTILLEDNPIVYDMDVDLSKKETPHMYEVGLTYELDPGEFILASTQQVFHLPDDVACQFVLKSSLARAGLNHLMAGWCDPTWNNSALTMELQNVTRFHTLVLREGMKIGQMVFFRTTSPVPQHAAYATVGQYNGDRAATGSKGLR